MTIEEFIEARLVEDKAAAMAARPGPWQADRGSFGPVIGDGYLMIGDSCYPSYDDIPVEDTAHIARHDPARVLRQVAALQAIAGRRAGEHRERRPFGHCETCRDYDNHREYDPVPWPCPTVRAVASIWADHPDYRAEWNTP